MRIIIATPVEKSKGYSFERWLTSIRDLEWNDSLYGPKELIIADNTDDGDNAATALLESLINSLGITFSVRLFRTSGTMGLEPDSRRAKSRNQFINAIKIAHNQLAVDWWLSWECDMIPASNIMSLSWPLLQHTDILTYTYPERENSLVMGGGIGFAFFKISTLYTANLDVLGWKQCDPLEPRTYYSNDSWILNQILRGGARMLEVTDRGLFQHLNS